uniref:Uncharacterized protein n=1 Tax=Anguilla anguilla TaxID=7936 RepID=A0A0E9SVN1_ANGAN
MLVFERATSPLKFGAFIVPVTVRHQWTDPHIRLTERTKRSERLSTFEQDFQRDFLNSAGARRTEISIFRRVSCRWTLPRTSEDVTDVLGQTNTS